MEVMLLGDLHFAEYKDFSKNLLVSWDESNLQYVIDPKGKKINSRLLDIANAMVEAREYCVVNKINLVIITGDVSHNRGAVPTTVQNVEYKILESFRLRNIELLIIPGNHDQVSNEDFPDNSLVPFRNIATILNAPTTLTRDGLQMLCIPFSPNKDIVLEAINSFVPVPVMDSNLIVAHLGVSGGVTGKNSYVLTDQYDISELRYLDEDIDLVALGHYHKPQVVPGTLDKVFYTGSPVQNNFGEEGEFHGFWIYDTETKELVAYPLNAPRFITLTKDNYTNYSKEDLSGNFVRVIGNLEEIADINVAINTKEHEDAGMLRIETQKEYESEHRSDISAALSYLETVSLYAEENNFSEDQVKIGLDILNSVLESEV